MIEQEKQEKQGAGDQIATKNPNLIVERRQINNGASEVIEYKKGKLLGKGGFAKCYQVTNLSNQQSFAAKIVPKISLTKARAKSKLMSEVTIHKSLQHENIVKFEHVFEDETNVYLLLGLCQHETLNEIMKRRHHLHELEVKAYVIMILKALSYLHENLIIHRDLKLGNLFIGRSMILKLGDFGLATKLDFIGERKRTICGTPNYIAPEVIDDKNGHCFEADIWSLGVVIYTLLVGKPPFEAPDIKVTYERIRSNQYSFPDHIEITTEARNLVRAILRIDPKMRLTIDQIFEHSFLNNHPIPATLPISTIACPPLPKYIQQFKTLTKSSCEWLKLSVEKQRDSPFLQIENDNVVEVVIGSLFSGGPQNRDHKARLLQAFEKQSVYVIGWIDVAAQFGLGYLLNNGSVGAIFNDKSKAITSNQARNVQYYSNQPNSKQTDYSTFPWSEWPNELKKKQKLLTYFDQFLKAEHPSRIYDKENPKDMQNLVYITRWESMPEADIFSFSNKYLQICFRDKTELLICSQYKSLKYTNAEGKQIYLHADESLNTEGNREIAKRLHHVKHLLSAIVMPTNNAKRWINRRSSIEKRLLIQQSLICKIIDINGSNTEIFYPQRSILRSNMSAGHR